MMGFFLPYRMQFQTILLFLIVSLLSSCDLVGSEHKRSKYRRDGISFEIPEGWSITKEKPTSNGALILSIEKDGFDSSGYVSIVWFDEIIDLDNWKDKYLESFKNNEQLKNTTIQFSEYTKDRYSQFEAKKINYSFFVVGFKTVGEIYLFYQSGKSISVIQQFIEDEQHLVEPGLQVIEHSLSIK